MNRSGLNIEDELIEMMPKELLGIVEEYTRPLDFDTAPELSSIIEETVDVKVGDLLIGQYYHETVSVRKVIGSTKTGWIVCFCDMDREFPPSDYHMKMGDEYLYRLDTAELLTDDYTYEIKRTKPVKKIKIGTDAFIFIARKCY